MGKRTGKITFTTSIEMMSENEVVGIIGQARIMEIREKDKHPCLVRFCVGHEGVTRKGRSEKLGEVHQHWADNAVESLADAFDSPRRGGSPIPCYTQHSDFKPGHREPIGHVEAARTVKRKGRWEAHAVSYIPEGPVREDVKSGRLNVCSPECEVESATTAAGGMEIVRVLKATGLALGSTNLGHTPAFGGATFESAIQMFADDGDPQKNAEPKGRRPMEDLIIKTKEDLLMAVAQFRTAGILSENDLMNLPDVKKAFEREAKRDEAKAKSGDDTNKSTKTGEDKSELQVELDKANEKIASLTIGAKLPELLNEVLNKVAKVGDGEKHNLTEKEVDGILGIIKNGKYAGTDEDIRKRIEKDIEPALNLVNIGRSNASSETTTQKTTSRTQRGEDGKETKTGSDHEGVIPAMVDDALVEASKAANGTTGQ